MYTQLYGEHLQSTKIFDANIFKIRKALLKFKKILSHETLEPYGMYICTVTTYTCVYITLHYSTCHGMYVSTFQHCKSFLETLWRVELTFK